MPELCTQCSYPIGADPLACTPNDCWAIERDQVLQHGQDEHRYHVRHDCPLCPDVLCENCGRVLDKEDWPYELNTYVGLATYCSASCAMSKLMVPVMAQ